MKGKKKNRLQILFLVVVFALTIHSIFKGQDLRGIIKAMAQINPWYLIPGITGVILFIWGESIIIHYMMGTLAIKTKKRTCFVYSCIGFFFSCITPSASGGQPAQIYYMHKNNIPVPVSSMVLMIVTITYKFVLVIIGIFLLVFQNGFVRHYLTKILPVFYLGVILNVICCFGMSLLAFHPVLAKSMMLKILSILEKIHFLKNKPKRKKRLEEQMNQYNETAAYFGSHKRVIFNVLVITFFQRFALFFVTWFVYRSFGFHSANIYDVIMLQAVVSISVDMLPLPGGMEISENLFLIIFKPIYTAGLLLPGMILSRGIAYYVQLFFSAIVTVFAHFTIGRKIANE